MSQISLSVTPESHVAPSAYYWSTLDPPSWVPRFTETTVLSWNRRPACEHPRSAEQTLTDFTTVTKAIRETWILICRVATT
jgi:hypothetical protein